ncbi:MAG: low molecular weight phosphotyrosine protein phosphatase [Clostridia bacterium]|nr:low molecular weight phosphotyrosine protein phosphatase [Clostridia bacterium]
MIRILFICHGNICRSPAAEMVMNQIIKMRHLQAFAASSATTREEIGNDIYPPMARELRRRGILIKPHCARQTVPVDYDAYDLIIGMDQENREDLFHIFGGDPRHKISLLLSWCNEARDVSDPWYTRDFAGALDDIEKGCAALAETIEMRMVK